MQHTLHHAIRRYFAPALLSLAVGFSSAAAQAAATFNPATGELSLPAVTLDWEPGLYAVSLKRTAVGNPLRLGDEFSVETLDASTAEEPRRSNFQRETSTAYVSEVVVNTAEGEKAYRLLLRMMPNGALRVTSLEEATLYSATSGDPLLSQHMQRLEQQIAQAEMPVSCSSASLYGIYGYAAAGTRQIEGEWKEYFEVGTNYFDGQGTVSNTYTNSLNFGTHTVAGTYSVAPDCRGEMDYETGDKFHFFTPPMGDKFFYIQASTPEAPAVQSGWMQRQSKGLETGCDASTLMGTYVYGAKGIKNATDAADSSLPYRESGLESYDGQGNVTNLYTDNQTGVAQYAKGTYLMTEDCDALVSYESGDSYLMHVAPDGEKLVFLQFDGLQAGEMMGGAKYRVSMLTQTFAAPAAATTTTRRAMRNGDADKCPIGYSGTPPSCLMGFDFSMPHFGKCEAGYTLVTGVLTSTCSKKPAASSPTPTQPSFTTTSPFPAEPGADLLKNQPVSLGNLGSGKPTHSSLTPDRTSVLEAQGNTVYSKTLCSAQGAAYVWTKGTCTLTYDSSLTGDMCYQGFASKWAVSKSPITTALPGTTPEVRAGSICELVFHQDSETIQTPSNCEGVAFTERFISKPHLVAHLGSASAKWTSPRCIIPLDKGIGPTNISFL